MLRKQFLVFSLGVFVAILGTSPVLAQWKSVGAMAAQAPRDNQITFANRNANVVIQVLAPDLMRVRMSVGKTAGPDYSWAVIKKDWPAPEVKFSGDKQTKVIKTSALEARIQLSPLPQSFYDPSGRLISSRSEEE